MSRPPVFVSEGYVEAQASASAAGKLLVLDATASWCQPCKAMDRVTWVDPKVTAWFAARAVAVQIDVDEQKDLAHLLGIRSMPTVIAFRGGKEVDRVVGMKGPGDLLAWLDALERGETAVDQARRASEAVPTNMQLRCGLARALAQARRFREAADEYVWLWQHMVEHEPAMVGVRMSFMLAEIGSLARDDAPARERFTALRDALGVDGPPGTATSDEVSDWVSLTSALGEEERILRWADGNASLFAARPELERTVRIRVVPLLVERGRWADVGRFYRDGLLDLWEAYQPLVHASKGALPPGLEGMRAEMLESLEALFRKEAGQIVAALLAAERERDARAVLKEARRLMPGEKTERALLTSAKEAGVELPTEES